MPQASLPGKPAKMPGTQPLKAGRKRILRWDWIFKNVIFADEETSYRRLFFLFNCSYDKEAYRLSLGAKAIS